MLGQLRRRAHGFSLLELLVVIAIMGVLLAIVIPRTDKAQDVGKASQCKASLQEIESALEMYYSDHNSYPESGDLQTLVNEGYLKRVPVCPAKNDTHTNVAYAWKADPSADPDTFNYRDLSTTSNAYSAGRAFCNYHGTLDEFYPGGKPGATESNVISPGGPGE